MANFLGYFEDCLPIGWSKMIGMWTSWMVEMHMLIHTLRWGTFGIFLGKWNGLLRMGHFSKGVDIFHDRSRTMDDWVSKWMANFIRRESLNPSLYKNEFKDTKEFFIMLVHLNEFKKTKEIFIVFVHLYPWPLAFYPVKCALTAQFIQACVAVGLDIYLSPAQQQVTSLC